MNVERDIETSASKCHKCDEERGSSIREVYGEFSCKSCTQLWNRDENAAINIKRVVTAYLRSEARPAHLAH